MLKTFRALLVLMALLVGCKRTPPAVPIVNAHLGCAPVTTDADWYKTSQKAPLFEGMGNLDMPISTDTVLVQRYFNQGLTLAYGFNHAEAARSFYYASQLDTTCAMAYWGYAYVLGPNYNAGMEADNYERAYAAVQKALRLVEHKGTAKEKDLITALSLRYAPKPPEDRRPLDEAYAQGMAALSTKYPEDANIGTLYAEALMNLHPWDLYDTTGEAREWTPEILRVLQSVIQQHPDHCGAHHFYIHAVESSAHPEIGLASAQVLDSGLVPSAGHLMHMPSHIYIRTGNYHAGTLSNLRAIAADSSYVTVCHAQGAYPLAYFPHNQHFMAATATLEGNSKWALFAADEVSHNANLQIMKEPGWGTLQHYYTIPWYVYVKFGQWDHILQMENKAPELPYTVAMQHYAQGMAHLAKQQPEAAEKDWEKLHQISLDQDLKTLTIWDINTVYDLVQIAEKVLHAHILAQKDQRTEGIQRLREAVALEDRLNYNEPPDWFFSVRHYLGAMLLDDGQYEQAVSVYKEDLHKLPNNGWALNGLALAYSGLGKTTEANATKEAFDRAWAHADTPLKGSIVK